METTQMIDSREMFEAYFKTVWKGIDLIQTVGEDFAFKLLDGKYVERIVEEHWRTWQASAQRQGYKLVPVELVDEIEDKIWENLSANHTITNQEGDGFIPVEDIDLGGIYKAMIGKSK